MADRIAEVVAKGVKIKIHDRTETDGDVIVVDIYVNDKGNLCVYGLPNVVYELYNDELIFSKFDGEHMTTEVCGPCGEEVELEANMKLQKCPKCSALIAPCLHCRDLDEKRSCLKCPLGV